MSGVIIHPLLGIGYNLGMRTPRLGLLPLALLLLVLPVFAQAAPPPDRPELRAFWVDGFNDGFKTPAQCDLLLARLRAMHCNSVFVQMRKRADAYYGSHYEGWAQDDPEHFDALQYLCDHAHAPGLPRIQIHAWINACAIGGNKSAGALTKLHPEWLSLSDTGADFDTEATKIDPGNPDAAEWTFRVYMDVVRHYDVDGIHLDFIRYGGDGKTVGHWGYNAVSVARYNARYGLPTGGQPRWNDPRWQAWRREQVTALVRRIYVNAIALRPKIVVSAATICWGNAPVSDTAYETTSASYTEVFAPWRDWMREGILDLNCPMSYFSQTKSASKWAGWNTFAKDRQFGRQCVMGIGAYLNDVPASLAMIGDTRQPTAQGSRAAGAMLYCYDTPVGINGQEMENDPALFAALPGFWKHNAPVPAMPWKTRPTMGAISGTLLNGLGLTPMDEAEITLEDQNQHTLRTGRADGNGRFAFVSLPPGSYRVNADWNTGHDELYARVLAGRVAQVTVVHSGDAKSISEVRGIGAQPENSAVVVGETLVTSGSDKLGDYFFVADGFGQPTIRVDAPHLVPPVIMGDKVVISGTLHHTPGGVTLTAEAVRLVGMERVTPGE